MIDHADWITRLASHASALAGRAYDVAQYLRDAPAWPATPAAYVHPHGDDPGDDYQPICPRQSVTALMSVLIVVGATGTTAQAFGTLVTARQSIRAALLGWQPPGALDSVLYAGGQAEEFYLSDPKAGLPATLVWRDTYSTRYLLTP